MTLTVQKSPIFKNLAISIGGMTISEICQGSMACYVRISKRRNRLPTIGTETIFECSAWQLMRVQKSMIFNNIAIFSGGTPISEICKTVIFKNHCISIGGRTISEIRFSLIGSFPKWEGDFCDMQNSQNSDLQKSSYFHWWQSHF